MYTLLKNSVLLLILLPISMVAQEKFYVRGEKVAYTGKGYKISFVLENAKGSNFRPPSKFEGFSVASGPNQSSNFQWVNGVTTQSMEYYYILQPMQEGSFTIPSASIEVNGTSLITEPLNVTIKKGNSSTQPSNNRTYNNQSTASNTDWKQQAKESIFVRMYADKNTAYVGEQVTVYVKYYSKVQSYNTQYTELPAFNGFWKQDFKIDNQEWKKEEYNGQYFNTLLVGKYALFPQKDGELTIDPIKLTTTLRLQTQNQNPQDFWSFFSRPSYENVQYDFQSSPITITAEELPIQNKPSNFSGAVGKFNLSVSTPTNEIETGEAFTVNQKLSGTGNIMMIDLPELLLPESVEVFDPQTNENISKNATKVNGSIESDYIVIAQQPGDFTIPPTEFSYFDVEQKQYKTISTNPISIQVTGENLVPTVAENTEEVDEDILVLEDDIRYINTDFDLQKSKQPIIEKISFYAALASAPILFLLLLLFRNKLEEFKPDLVAVKNKRARKLAEKRMQTAKTFLEKREKKAFYTEVNNALWGYISDKLNLGNSELSRENVKEKLLVKQVAESKIDDLVSLIDKCEQALYSPFSNAEMQQDFETSKTIIIDIENEITG